MQIKQFDALVRSSSPYANNMERVQELARNLVVLTKEAHFLGYSLEELTEVASSNL